MMAVHNTYSLTRHEVQTGTPNSTVITQDFKSWRLINPIAALRTAALRVLVLDQTCEFLPSTNYKYAKIQVSRLDIHQCGLLRFRCQSLFQSCPSMDVATFSLFLLRILSACAALWLIGLDRIGLALNQLHYWLAARKPQLTYKPSMNNRILESALTMVIEEPYHPTWYLFWGHLHSLLLNLNHEAPNPSVPYERELVKLSDGGVVALDWATLAPPERQINQPTVLLLHGLTGGSRAIYIRMHADRLLKAGYRVVVMNARGCNKTPVQTPKLFSLGCTNDVRESVVHIRQRIGARVVLIGVGFSLGANLLVKYLGEEGKNAQLTSAVSICNPYCCTTTHQLLTYSWPHRVVYNTILGKCMVKYFFKLSNAAEVHKDHPALDYDALRKCRYLSDYDEQYTRRIFGFDTVTELYRDASCTPYIKHVAIPLLCLSSKDDPISSHTAIPYADCSINPNVVLAVTHTGGHMAFYTGNASPHMWVSDIVVNYVHATVKLSKEGMITPNLQTAQDGTALPKLSSVGTQVADHRTSHFA
ncbi:hypothetical protein AeMF1_011106 [Aphanomyces euteiches]|nr:hypothetical protein AeMF1_011106 [Aphanomyces euteiches]